MPSGALIVLEGRHGTQIGKATKLKPWRLWVRIPLVPLLTRVVLLTAVCKTVANNPCEAVGGRFNSFITHCTARSSIGSGHQPLTLKRRVRFPHELFAGASDRSTIIPQAWQAPSWLS